MSLHSIAAGSFARLLADEVRKGAEVIAPAIVNGRPCWRRTTAEALESGPLDLGPARASEPIKALFFPPRGEVSRFFGEDSRPDLPDRILVGARQCDLAALRILDFVFLEGPFKDPFYAARRGKTLVISADCNEPYETCFCTAVEGQPYATKGYDLNLSDDGSTLLVETGSVQGDRFVEEHRVAFGRADETARRVRDEARKVIANQIEARAKERQLEPAGGLRHVTRGREEHEVWDARAKDCVECGACNFACPTCHCFYLLDVESGGGVRRFADWDACLYPKFARVAGGANPRPRRAQRLLNRLEKKFSFFCDTTDALACTGCGRCVEACAGKIDIRDMLKELVR